MSRIRLRDVSLNVEVVGHGPPLVLMHGGPSADLWTLLPFRRLADRFTLVFYDHRCNGRSNGVPLESMTWDNLVADAEALREHLGFERWAVLGHSFGGQVALEYALRHPDRVSRLVLMNTGGDASLAREHAPRILAERGYSPKLVRLVHRFFTGRVPPKEVQRALLRMGPAYHHCRGLSLIWLMARDLIAGEWRTRLRGEPLTYAGRVLMPGWSVMDRLGEITAPTLVLAGRSDFLFPPEHQALLASRIPNARLRIVERAGHNPHSEQPEVVMRAVAGFLSASVSPARGDIEQEAAVSSRIGQTVVNSRAEVAPRAAVLTTS
jgi:proline iminopeptidase